MMSLLTAGGDPASDLTADVNDLILILIPDRGINHVRLFVRAHCAAFRQTPLVTDSHELTVLSQMTEGVQMCCHETKNCLHNGNI